MSSFAICSATGTRGEGSWPNVKCIAKSTVGNLKRDLACKNKGSSGPHFVLAVSSCATALGADKAHRRQQVESLAGALREQLPNAAIVGLSSSEGALSDTWNGAPRDAFLSLWGICDSRGTFKVGSCACDSGDLEQRSKAADAGRRAANEALQGAPTEPPKLVLFFTTIGSEEGALQGLNQELVQRYGSEEAVSKVQLFGGTASGSVFSPPSWWLFGSAPNDAATESARSTKIFARPPFGVCMVFMWPTCGVHADFHHAFSDTSITCWAKDMPNPMYSGVVPKSLGEVYAAASFKGAVPKSLEATFFAGETSNATEPLVETPPSSRPVTREILTVQMESKSGEDQDTQVLPAAVWYDTYTFGAITDEVVKAMEDSVGQMVLGVPALYVLYGNIALGCAAAVVQYINALDLWLSCRKDVRSVNSTPQSVSENCNLFHLVFWPLVGILLVNMAAMSVIFHRRWKDLQQWIAKNPSISGAIVLFGMINSNVLKLVGSYAPVPFTKKHFPALHNRQKERQFLWCVYAIEMPIRDIPVLIVSSMQLTSGMKISRFQEVNFIFTLLNFLLKLVTLVVRFCAAKEIGEGVAVKPLGSGLARCVLDKSAEHPIARILPKDRSSHESAWTQDFCCSLIHVGFVTPEGGLLLMADVVAGSQAPPQRALSAGRRHSHATCKGDELVLMHSSMRSLGQLRSFGVAEADGCAKELYHTEDTGGMVHGALMVVCAGMVKQMLMQDPTTFQTMSDMLLSTFASRGGFLCYFPYGEQGRPRNVVERLHRTNAELAAEDPSTQPQPFTHSNLMYASVVFSDQA